MAFGVEVWPSSRRCSGPRSTSIRGEDCRPVYDCKERLGEWFENRARLGTYESGAQVKQKGSGKGEPLMGWPRSRWPRVIGHTEFGFRRCADKERKEMVVMMTNRCCPVAGRRVGRHGRPVHPLTGGVPRRHPGDGVHRGNRRAVPLRRHAHPYSGCRGGRIKPQDDPLRHRHCGVAVRCDGLLAHRQLWRRSGAPDGG